MGNLNITPVIRFPEYKDAWELKFGNEVFKSVSNKEHNSDLPILAISQEFGAVPRELINYQISVTDKSIESYKVIEVGDFIISLRSFQGGIEYSIYKGICSPAYIILRPFIEVDRMFFKYYFKTYKYIQHLNRKLEGIRDGKMISYKYFSEIAMPLPTIPEQTRIASFFSVLDKKINQLIHKKILLEQYKKGVMQKLLSQELRFIDDNGKEFAEWEKLSFGKLYSFKTTNSFSRDKFNYEIGSVKNIHYGDIHTKFKTLFDVSNEVVPFINSDVKLDRIDEENYCQMGDLVIADASEDYSDIGKTIEVINLQNEKVLAGLHTILARPVKNRISIGFGGYLMGIDYVQLQIRKIAQGTKVLGLSSKKLSDITINLPSKSEQTKIVDFITALNNKIYRTENQIYQNQQYKKSLLQNMFV